MDEFEAEFEHLPQHMMEPIPRVNGCAKGVLVSLLMWLVLFAVAAVVVAVIR